MIINPNMNTNSNMNPNMNPNTNMAPNMNEKNNMDMQHMNMGEKSNMNMHPINMGEKNNMNMHHMNMSEREKALWKVQAYEFALVEVGLFLDTHPNDQTALSYFKQYRDMKHKAESDYTKRFGPITMDHMDNDLSTWKWIDNPWPWEIGSEV